jgi:hypothetical protein
MTSSELEMYLPEVLEYLVMGYVSIQERYNYYKNEDPEYSQKLLVHLCCN